MGELNVQVQRQPKSFFDDEQYNEYLLTADDLGIKPVVNPVTEEELLRKDFITPDDIIRLRTYTENYLCPISANIYGIQFVRYAVRDFEKGVVLFELKTYEDTAFSYEEELLQVDNTLLEYTHDTQGTNTESFLGAISTNESGHQQNKVTVEKIDFSDQNNCNTSMFPKIFHLTNQSKETADKCLDEVNSTTDCFQKVQPLCESSMFLASENHTTDSPIINDNSWANVANNNTDLTSINKKETEVLNDNISKEQKCLPKNFDFFNISKEDKKNNILNDVATISDEDLEKEIDRSLLQYNIMDNFYLESSTGLKFVSDRQVSYHLSPEILQMSTVGATVEFKVGNQEIKNFRMIELHFFKDKLIKMFDFDFGFCIPNSLNSWEHIYQLPKLPIRMVTEMINSPFETKSETFYFVDGKLVIHNKANYAYTGQSETEWN